MAWGRLPPNFFHNVFKTGKYIMKKIITDEYVKVPSGIYVNANPGVLTLSINTNTLYAPEPSYYGDEDDIPMFGAVLYKGTTKIKIDNYDFMGVKVSECSVYAPENLRKGYANYGGLYLDEYNHKSHIEMECCVAHVPESCHVGEFVTAKPITDLKIDKLKSGNTYAILARVPRLPWFYAWCYDNVHDMKERGKFSAKCCLWRASEYVAESTTPFWPDKRSLRYALEYQKLKSIRTK